jgi:hypothetical protein
MARRQDRKVILDSNTTISNRRKATQDHKHVQGGATQGNTRELLGLCTWLLR